MRDSLINKLTKEQKEFFKDSKVRDNDNNLLICYHGSDSLFSTFSHDFIADDNKDGYGFYFTLGKELQFEHEAKYACYLNITRPLYDTDDNFEDVLVRELELRKTMSAKKVLETISEEFDIDGIIDYSRNNAVCFFANQIKKIDNLKPTDSDDMNEKLDMNKYLYDEPVHGPSFITEEGKFLRCPGDTHTTAYSFLDDDEDYNSVEDFCNKYHYIRVNDGSVVSFEVYMNLTKEKPTDAQFKAIEKYLDYVLNKDIEGVSIDIMNTDEFQHYSIYDADTNTDEIMNKIRNYYTSGKLRESLLIEKNRQELINKSRSGREYSKKNQLKGKNRWERRRYSQIANSVRDYNQIDMNSFFKGDILEFKIKVKGETDDYLVTITFEHILKNIQQEIKSNNNKLEFKCILRALLRSFNGEDVYINCTCPDFNYRFAHNATKGRYNSGRPELRPNLYDWTNKNDDMGAGCKHINLVLSNTDWMMKIASVINNYIKWCKENMQRNYADIIFPAVYGMRYDKAVQLSIFDDEENNGYLPSDQKYISQVIDTGFRGKDDKGKWAKGNEFRFSKKNVEKAPEDDERQMHLDLGLDTMKKKQIRPEEKETTDEQ